MNNVLVVKLTSTCLRIHAFLVQKLDDVIDRRFRAIHFPVAANEKFPSRHFSLFLETEIHQIIRQTCCLLNTNYVTNNATMTS